MGYIYFANNPCGLNAGDCSVRAVSKVLNLSWDEAFDILVDTARLRCSMPNANSNIDVVLSDYGFRKETFSDCYKCHTVRDFANSHPRGRYVLGTGDHVVAVVNGNYYDSWDSGNESIMYFWGEDF